MPQKLRVYYVLPNGVVLEASGSYKGEQWEDDWLNLLIKDRPDVIFFFTTETTDIDWSLV